MPKWEEDILLEEPEGWQSDPLVETETEDTWDYVLNNPGRLADTIPSPFRESYEQLMEPVKDRKEFEEQFVSAMYLSHMTGASEDFAWGGPKQLSRYLFKQDEMSPGQIVSKAAKDNELIKKYISAWNSWITVKDLEGEKPPRYQEWINRGAAGMANVGSGVSTFLEQRKEAYAEYKLELAKEFTKKGMEREANIAIAAARKATEDKKTFSDFGDLMWEVSRNPDLALKNDDTLNKLVGMVYETIPYMTATTTASIIGGPFGGFAVGWAVAGSSAYRKALAEGVSEEQARRIGAAVGIVSGGIEAFGGKLTAGLAAKITQKFTNGFVKGTISFTLGSINEGLEEFTQEIADIVGEKQYREVGMKEAMGRSMIAAAGGGILGGGFHMARASLGWAYGAEGMTQSEVVHKMRFDAAQGELTKEMVQRFEEDTKEAVSTVEEIEKPAEAVEKAPEKPVAPLKEEIRPVEPAKAVPEEKPPAAPEVKQPWEMTKLEFDDWYAEEFQREYGRPLQGTQLMIAGKQHPHRIQEALDKGKLVPRHVLEEYKSESWAQEALAKLPTEPPGTPPAVEEKITPISEPKKPVEKPKIVGEVPERKISRAAERIQDEAIAKDLTESLGDLPTYETMSMKEQARMAAEEINQDYEKAKQMAYGKINPPKDLKPASIYRAVAKHAEKEGDVETLRNLAVVHPNISLRLTELGKEIKAADVGIIADPVKAMQDITKVKEKTAKKRKKIRDVKKWKTHQVKEAKKEIKKQTHRRQSWGEFVESIRC